MQNQQRAHLRSDNSNPKKKMGTLSLKKELCLAKSESSGHGRLGVFESDGTLEDEQ